MFSGIIEAQETIEKVEELNQALRIWIRRPPQFDDIKEGESIAVDGVCLTLEPSLLEPQQSLAKGTYLQFTVGHETMTVLKRKQASEWLHRSVNLERSLRFGDRVHGHFVSGHVEDVGLVKTSEALGENWLLNIELPENMRPFCWRKGSVSVNGTSLTINQVVNNQIELCLIPETQKRTNLAKLKLGDHVCLEPDPMARAFFEAMKQWRQNV